MLNWAGTQTIASAATTDIGAATSNVVIISGTTAITGLGTIAPGAERCVTFSGALTLTHNATSLILPGGANITTAAGDVAYFASLGAGNWRCTGYQKANGVPTVPLANFAESLNTASPNTVVPVVSLTPTNAATNVDVAFVPKGNGAITARVADGTATGGNKRGQWAVDLQTRRTAASQVASGALSIILGGADNTASGNLSIASGNASLASSTESVVLGGYAGIASATRSIVFGGNYNIADGEYSIAMGYAARARAVAYSQQYGYASRVAGGDRQKRYIPLIGLTTNATTTTLTTDGAAESSSNTWVLRNNLTGIFNGWVVARDTTNNDSKGWRFEGMVSRDASASTVALLGAATITAVGTADASMASVTLTVTVNTTNGSLIVQANGLAATTISWVGELGPVFENG